MKTINKILFVFAVCFAFGMNVSGQCPTITGILPDACGATEGFNEFVLLNTGGSALSPNDISIDTPSGNDYDTWITADPALFSEWNCPCCVAVDGTSTIPANSTVIIVDAATDFAYDWSTQCTGLTLYVLMDDSGSATGGHFGNSGGRTSLLLNTNAACATTSYTYTTASVSGGDGDYTAFAGPDNPTYASAGNNGEDNVNSGNTSSMGSCTPDISNSIPANCSITIDNVVFTEPTCTGATLNADGTITITATGSNLTGALEYSIDGGTTWQATGDFTALAGGSYNVVVRDAGDLACSASEAAATVLTDPTCTPAPTCNPSITSFPVNN